MPTLRANGLEIGYREAGEGPPLLLLHGASSSGEEDYGTQLERLGTAFHAVAPDARGHATTRWDVRDGFRYEWLVDDSLAVADALGFDTFHLLGFSMGAATALGVAARAPERLRTLVLVGLSPDRQPRASVARRLFDPARILAHDPAWAAELARRHDPVQGDGAWERLLPAIAADVASQQLLVLPDSGHELMRRHPALWDAALAGFYTETASIAAARAAGRPTPVMRAEARMLTSAHHPAPADPQPDPATRTEASA